MSDESILRYRHVCYALWFGYALICAHLMYIQIAWRDDLRARAYKQYHCIITTLPPRALIYDSVGRAVAANTQSYSLWMSPRAVHHPEQLRAFLTTHFPQSIARWDAHPHKSFIYIKRHISDAEYNLILQSNISDIHVITESCRNYPYPCMAEIIGTTDIDMHGMSGIELLCNAQLSGTPRRMQVEKDARSRMHYFAHTVDDPGTDGTPIHLYIDSTLQACVQAELRRTLEQFCAQEAAALIMDPVTGAIISMASVSADNSMHGTLCAIAHAHECGSVIKIAAALAALEEGVVAFDELIDCKNSKTTTLFGRTVNTPVAAGVLPFWQVVAQSNNIGIVQVTQRLGTKLYDHYQRMGFGALTAIDLPGEIRGHINAPAQWSKHSLISLSYGYEISVTLIQLARLMGLIATGYLVTPRIINSGTPAEHTARLYSESSCAELQEILHATTTVGTAWRARIPGYRILAKTGTAQLLVNGAYSTTRHMYTCAGIIGKDDWQRVIALYIKDIDRMGLFAATVAVPLFERIAQRVIMHEHV